MTSRRKSSEPLESSAPVHRSAKRPGKPKPAPLARRKRAKPPEGGKRLTSDERRRQIIEAVEELFKTRPYAEIGVPDVAALVGITQGLVYHYFPTKEALLVAAVELRAQELLRFCVPDGAQPFLVQLEGAVKGYVDYVEAHGVTYANLFNGPSASEPDILRICEETRQVLIEHFMRALGLAKKALPVTRLSLRGYFGYAECIILKWLERRSVPRSAIERLCLQAALSALVAGLQGEREAPLSPAQVEQLVVNYKQHFAL